VSQIPVQPVQIETSIMDVYSVGGLTAAVLNSAIDGKTDIGHTHSAIYYTKAEIDVLVGGSPLANIGIIVQDEGTQIHANAKLLNFVGDGVVVTLTGGSPDQNAVTITLTASGLIGIDDQATAVQLTVTDSHLLLATGKNFIFGTAALATTATDGFLYLSSMAGTPTGTPTNNTDTIPFTFDSTNGKLYFYDRTGSPDVGWTEISGAGGITDHTLLTNIGTNTHTQIDTHIADATIHFTEASISITESQISDLQTYLLNITGENIEDLSNVTLAGSPAPISGQVLTYDGAVWYNATPVAGITDHTLLTNIGTNTHAQIDTHISDATIHFTEASISITESQISDLQSYLLNITNESLSDLSDVTLVGSPAPISGDVLRWSGSAWNNYPDSNFASSGSLTAHTGDATIHFTEASIDHTAIANIGTNTHAQIDTHISDATLHFTEASISITESQISDLQSYLLNITGEPLSDLSDVTITTIASGELLKWDGAAWINNTLAEAGISATTHNHTGVYEPADGTILKDADIGVTVQAFGDALDDINTIGVTTAINQFYYSTSAGVLALGTVTSFGRALIDDASVSAQRTTLGLVAGGAGDIWVEKAGDSMDSTANITFAGGGEILGLPATPTTAGSAASKAYVDALVSSATVRRDPIRDPDLVGIVGAEPGSPQTGGGYITTAAGTWTGSVSVIAGDYVYWTGSAWTFIQNVAAGDRFGVSMEHGTIESSMYDIGFRDHDLIEYVSGAYNTFGSWITPSDDAYQVIDFTTPHLLSDSTGFANDATVYVLDVTTDVGAGDVLSQVQVVGSAAQTFTNLITEINIDLDSTFGAGNVVAIFEPEGHIHIENTAVRNRVTIKEGTAAGTGMLATLTNFNTILAGIEDGTTVIVNDPDSVHYGHTYLYSHEGNGWTEISGPGAINAGNGLYYDGNTLNAFDATTTVKGVASFNSNYFSVSAGAVSLSATIDDLTDITLTGLSAGEILVSAGSPLGWINNTLAEAGIAAAGDLTSHTGDATIHFTEASIDHTAITNIGTNTHAQIDTHIADATLHFTEASIDHTAIANIGTNTHAQIDTHIADATIHFTEASISITESQISDLQSYLLNITGENIEDLANVTLVGSPAPVTGDLLRWGGSAWNNYPDSNFASSGDLTSHTGDATIHFTEASIDHTAIANIGTNTHAQIDTHISDATIHFTEASISITESQISDLQSYLLNITAEPLSDLSDVSVSTLAAGEILVSSGSPLGWVNNTLAEAGIAASGDLTSHTGDATIHFTEASIVHQNISGAGTNTHAQIDTHIADATIHFTEASIDHKYIANIGTNTHAQIDTHIADTTIHFTEASISITESQISDLQSYLLNITGENITDLSDVSVTALAAGEILVSSGSPLGWVNNTLAEAGIAAAGDLTSHTGDATVHFTEASIDHTAIANIGTNTHAQIDTHIADATVHFTEASISITESQISDLQTYLLNITGEPLSDLSDVSVTALAAGEILVSSGSPLGWINNTLAEAGIAASGHNHDATYVNVSGDTMTGDLLFGDNDNLYLGTGNDLQIFHDGTSSNIDNHTGILYITNRVDGGTVQIGTEVATNVYKTGIVVGDTTADVRLFYDGGKVFETVSGGVRVADGQYVYLGNTNDLSLTHDGANSALANVTGDLYIDENVNSGLIYLRSKNSGGTTQPGIIIGGATPNVRLHYAGSNKLETTSAGITITGTVNADAVDVNGLTADATPDGAADYVMTYDASAGTNKKVLLDELPVGVLASMSDVTLVGSPAPVTGDVLRWGGFAWNNYPDSNFASASSLTSHTGDATIHFTEASISITESQISDLQSYLLNITAEPLSDLSDVTITSIASNEILKWSGTAWINNTLAEAGISATSHNHDATYVNVSGDTMTGDLHFGDNDKVYLGNGNDLEIYHSPGLSYITNNSGLFAIQNKQNSGNIFFQTNNSSLSIRTCLSMGGSIPSVLLYYDGFEVLKTVSNGVRLRDNIFLYLGTDNDLQLSHTGSIAAIANTTGDFYIQENVNSGLIYFQTKDSIGTTKNVIIVGGATPDVKLYYDSGEKLATTSTGITITGLMNADAVDINGLTTDASPDNTADYVMTYDVSGGANKKVLIDALLSSVNAISDLTDTTITALGAGEVLVSAGSPLGWINNTLAEAGIEPAFSKNTAFNKNFGTSAGTVSEGNHTHTGVYEPADGTILKDADIGVTVQAYDATYLVDADIGVTVAAFAHNHTLDGLSNVTITTIASNEILKWSGSAWINNTLAEAGVAASGDLTSHTGDATIHFTQAAISITESQISDLQSYSLTSHNHTLDSLSNVTISAIASGEILKWNGSIWINNTLAEAGISATGHNHDATYVNITGDTMTGDLTINGTLFATAKSFKIVHPLDENKTLTYGSLEGPENGIYHRGTVTGDVIDLPDYWKALVDEGSITVTLTPRGTFQKLYVKSTSAEKIIIGIANWFKGRNSINCDYVVYAERNDISKLQVEE